jgi:hypothetical protein
VILFPGQRKVRARALRSSVVPAVLDGAAVPVSAPRSYAEVGASFESAGDQWVTADVEGSLASRSESQLALVDATGETLVGLGQATFGGMPDLWYLPEPGRYRLMVRTDPGHGSGTVRLSTARVLDQQMPADGTPLAFTARQPGEWMLATGHLGKGSYQLTAEAQGTTEWTAAANILPFFVCRIAFCGDSRSALLTQDISSNYFPMQVEGDWLYLVALGEGQTGTVSLRVTPTG